jgi:hypothetical protein
MWISVPLNANAAARKRSFLSITLPPFEGVRIPTIAAMQSN